MVCCEFVLVWYGFGSCFAFFVACVGSMLSCYAVAVVARHLWCAIMDFVMFGKHVVGFVVDLRWFVVGLLYLLLDCHGSGRICYDARLMCDICSAFVVICYAFVLFTMRLLLFVVNLLRLCYGFAIFARHL